MIKAMWYTRSDDRYEVHYPFNLGDIVYIDNYDTGVYDVVDYNTSDTLQYTIDGDLINCQLYEEQLLFPIKSTKLSRKIYPDVPEKEGYLWIKNYESNVN